MGRPPTSMRVAIVSTHRRWTASSLAWARYHLDIGFAKVYVYVDDGDVDATRDDATIGLTPCTSGYWQTVSAPSPFTEFLKAIRRDIGSSRWGTPERVMQRQLLNTCAALHRAVADGIDWLLHIDDDEVFWCPDDTVVGHFESLSRARIQRTLYWNHEAVLPAVDGPARGLLFKKNPVGLSDAQEAAIPEVMQGKPYFVSHRTGKGAARVLPGTVPSSVHLFQVGDPMHGFASFKVPTVLHRPYSSARQFCDKHLSQGEFPLDRVLGQPWAPPGVQAEAQALCRAKDIDGLRALYARAVTLTEADIDRLDARGYLLAPQRPLPFDVADTEPTQSVR